MSSEIVDEIKNSLEEIKRLHLKTQSFSASDSNVLLLQLSQQISFFPAFLAQQIKQITNLEKQFGEEFYGKCVDEVREIADTSKTVQLSIETLLKEHGIDASDGQVACTENLLKDQGVDASDGQIECAENLMKGMSRLNLLQQRITGKMMKSKK